ncbi:MAG: hypothetical protein CMQ12_04200 [Gammaproteobacteria bacterium]|nr:hypothetical protein [Gammaproteobacteria bacterium]
MDTTYFYFTRPLIKNKLPEKSVIFHIARWRQSSLKTEHKSPVYSNLFKLSRWGSNDPTIVNSPLNSAFGAKSADKITTLHRGLNTF